MGVEITSYILTQPHVEMLRQPYLDGWFSCACVHSMYFLWTLRDIVMTRCTIVKSACIVNWIKLYKIIETPWLWGGKHSFISLQQTVPVHKWHIVCTALGLCNSSWSGVCYYRMPNYNVLAHIYSWCDKLILSIPCNDVQTKQMSSLCYWRC